MIHEMGEDFAPGAAPPPPAMPVGVAEKAEDAVEQAWAGIFLSPERAAPKSVVVTSAEPGEGVSQLAASLALVGSSTEHGARVALVDLNVRHPTVAKVFGIPEAPGVLEILRDNVPVSAALVQAANPRLSLLAAGKGEDVPLSLLRSERVGELIRELVKDHDHVIIDAPAVNRLAIAPALATFTEGVVLVTRAGVTRRESVAEAKKRIELAQGKVVGIILNRREYPIPGFIYSRL